MQTLNDLKYSFRLLTKTPVFSCMMLLVVVVSLSLYLTSYTLGNLFANEPMPFPNGDDYVKMRLVDSNTNLGVGFPDFDSYILNRLSKSSDNYVELGAYQRNVHVFSDGEYSRPFSGVSISANLFKGLAANPLYGRSFDNDDSLRNTADVVLIGYTLWQEYYNANPEVVGNVSQIDGKPHTIIGVMPELFGFPRNAEFWLPLTTNGAVQPGEGGTLAMVGVLKKDSSYQEAESELTEILKQESSLYPEHYGNRAAIVYDYSDSYSGPGPSFRLPDYLNFVTLVMLLLAIVNLSSLLLIRYSGRKQELAVRSSLGADGWQLSKQVILESFIICFVGLLLSYALSLFFLKAFGYALVEQEIGYNYWFVFEIDTRGVFVGVFSLLAIWLSSSVLVAVRAFRSNPGDVLNTANKGNDGSKVKLATRIIVCFQLVLTCFLLICCGAMIHLMLIVMDVDHGVDPENLGIASVSLNHADYSEQRSRLSYLNQMRDSIVQVPGVVDVAVTSALPQRPGLSGTYFIEASETAEENQAPALTSIWVDNGYFKTANINVVEGRGFEIDDTDISEQVAIITEEFANQLWPGESAVGKNIQSTIGNGTVSMRVVGVITDVLQNITSTQALPSLYRPMSQGSPKALNFVIRVLPEIDITSIESALRESATSIDRNIPLSNIRSLEKQIYVDQQGTDLIIIIFLLFASVTLILASAGIYTVMARAIQLSTREIGVRRALGSTDITIALKYIKQGFRFLIVGLAIGGGLASILVSITAISFGLEDLQFIPLVVVLVSLLMISVVMTATIIPARRATALEPGDALRYE